MHVRCDRTVKVKICHPGSAEKTVELSEERFNRHVRHDLIQIDQPADALSPCAVDVLIHLAKQLTNRGIKSVIPLHLVRLRRETKLVRRVVFAQELAVEAVRKFMLENVSERLAE